MMKDFISDMASLLDGRTVAHRGNLQLNVGSLSAEPVSLPVLVDLGWFSLPLCRQTEYQLCGACCVK
jgi:hypothetical protein